MTYTSNAEYFRDYPDEEEGYIQDMEELSEDDYYDQLAEDLDEVIDYPEDWALGGYDATA